MLIPSIDVMNGKAVQLMGGETRMLERDDPVALARSFGRIGEIAVIDLDAALRTGTNGKLVAALCREAICRVGGGIRDVETARERIRAGADTIIVGTAALAGTDLNKPFLRKLCDAVGRQRVQVALDARRGRITADGWTRDTGLAVTDLLPELDGLAGSALVTLVENEGRQTGLNLEQVASLARLSPVPLTVAGGVRSAHDVSRARELGVDVQVGMSLYTGTCPLVDGMIAGLNWRDGLIPTIAVDDDGRVRMMAMSSPESVRRSLDTGRMWYWSRSRNRLWQKGETSGATQRLRRFRPDCDGDTLLAEITPAGPACHTGRDSCFGRLPVGLEDLRRVLRDRLERPREGSYTATLTPARMRQKLIEEAGEVALAASDHELVLECADLLYFLTVILADRDIPVSAVMAELDRRRA